jgi:hypothetical protein
MLSATTSSLSSALWHISSTEAVSWDGVNGNGKFVVVANNSNKINQALKITPRKILIPNVFNNINEHNYKIDVAQQSQVITTIELKQGFYSAQELCALINDAWIVEFSGHPEVGELTFSVGEFGYIECARSGSYAHDAYMLASPNLFHVLGYHTHSVPVAGEDNLHSISVYEYNIPGGFQTGKPNVGGCKLVHVSIPEMGRNNMIANSINGRTMNRNVVVTVPLHETAYGEYACLSTDDAYVDDIDYKNPLNIQKATIELLDENFNALTVPRNYPVHMSFKVYYNDKK